MKKILSLTLLLCVGLMFAGCDDDTAKKKTKKKGGKATSVMTEPAHLATIAVKRCAT